MKPAYTDEFLLEHLRRCYQETGFPPTMRTLPHGPGLPSAQTYIHRFGSWTAALEKAGLAPTDNNLYTEEELIKYLQTLGKKLGRTPTLQDVRAVGRPTAATFMYRFGSWQNALKAAGFETCRQGRRRALNRQALISQFRKLSEELGYPPGPAEVESARAAGRDIPSCRTFYRYFGTWERLLVAAGLVEAR